ncbi:MAG TPA: putative cytokinetic ring protein SteA, partial [Capsulimonadaceae bacterium]|nr:putative cytokinetic ring protein SteA [Capsulimonadaceae bacterium]
GLVRLQELGLPAETFRVSGTSEDAALLLAYEKGAELIVAVGTHTNLEDFLDKGRAGMASTFLVRLKVGSRLVDARGVSQLHRNMIGMSEVAALLLSAVFVGVVIFMETPVGHTVLGMVRFWWHMKLLGVARLWWHLRGHGIRWSRGA